MNMHHENRGKTENLTKREVPDSTVCSIVENKFVVVGCGYNLKLFTVVDNSNNIVEANHSLVTSFEIRNIECSSCYLVITGDFECVIKKIIHSDSDLLFEDTKTVKIDSKIQKTLLLSQNLLILHENGLDLFSFEKFENTFVFENEIIDISAIQNGDGIVFLLDKNGSIFYSDIYQ